LKAGVGSLVGTPGGRHEAGPVFERRYDLTVVTQEEKAQVERLRYILGQGVEDNLVEHVRDWPGVHCADALLDGTPLEGNWFDRTKEYAARNQGKHFDPLDFATTETVELTPIPCWAGEGARVFPRLLRRRPEKCQGLPGEAFNAGTSRKFVDFCTERRDFTSLSGYA